MNPKKYLLLLLLAIPVFSLFAQNDYCYRDSSYTAGVKLIDGGAARNSRLCQIEELTGRVSYTPAEVKEYGFKDGRIYYSKKIRCRGDSLQVFLLRLVKGKTNLYYYRDPDVKTFYLEKDSGILLELPRLGINGQKFRAKLADLTADCPALADAVKLAPYSDKALTELVRRYNGCLLKPFPFLKYGLSFEYSISNLLLPSGIAPEEMKQLRLPSSVGFNAGVFADIPLAMTQFSVHTELSYGRSSYAANNLTSTADMDFIANISSLSLPLMLRYSFPSKRVRPFANAGAIASLNLRNESKFYEALREENVITVSDLISSTLIPRYQAGAAAGAGLSLNLNYRNSVFLELRYTYEQGVFNPGTLNTSVIHFISGINF